MIYVLLTFAAIGALFLLAIVLRLSGFKGLYVGLEFHQPKELKESSEDRLAKSSRSVQRNARLLD